MRLEVTHRLPNAGDLRPEVVAGDERGHDQIEQQAGEPVLTKGSGDQLANARRGGGAEDPAWQGSSHALRHRPVAFAIGAAHERIGVVVAGDLLRGRIEAQHPARAHRDVAEVREG